MKQQCLLEQWEQMIQKVHKDGTHWRATRHSYICSKHFDLQDYQEPPSSGKCRLKRGAVASIFPTVVDENYNIPKETQHRLQPSEYQCSCNRKRCLGTHDIQFQTKRAKGDNDEIANKKLKKN